MAALSGKLTKNLVRTLGPGRHGDGTPGSSFGSQVHQAASTRSDWRIAYFMKTGPQMNTLLQNLQAKVESQSQATEEQTQQMLHDFEQHLTQTLNAAQRKIAHDMQNLEKLSAQIHRRTAAHIEDQAEKIREAMSDLDASRTEWRTVTWKTMLPTYLAGVLKAEDLVRVWALSRRGHGGQGVFRETS
jgi:DNA repair exonuclease SbcCD ATPase subunit